MKGGKNKIFSIYMVFREVKSFIYKFFLIVMGSLYQGMNK